MLKKIMSYIGMFIFGYVICLFGQASLMICPLIALFFIILGPAWVGLLLIFVIGPLMTFLFVVTFKDRS